MELMSSSNGPNSFWSMRLNSYTSKWETVRLSLSGVKNRYMKITVFIMLHAFNIRVEIRWMRCLDSSTMHWTNAAMTPKKEANDCTRTHIQILKTRSRIKFSRWACRDGGWINRYQENKLLFQNIREHSCSSLALFRELRLTFPLTPLNATLF